MRLLSIIIRSSAIFLIQGIRPLLGPAECKFALGCTQYAVELLQTKPLWQAIGYITLRLCCCSPLHRIIPKKWQDIVH